MRILIIDPHYSNFLESFYQKYPEIKKQTYEKQKKTIFAECFGTADFYSKNLKKLGHQIEKIISNNPILQKKWARENKIKYTPDYFSKIPKLRSWFKIKWPEQILEAQIKKFKPDIIYCHSLSNPSPKFLTKIKPYVKIIIGQVACPTVFNRNQLSHFDLILTSFPHFVDRFKKIGIKSEYLKIGFESSILKKLTKNKKQYASVFVGGFSRRHTAVIKTFEYLAKNTKIDFWGYGLKKLFPAPIHHKYHGNAWGIDMYNILYNAKISINRHIDAAENFANNMRLYESTGVGTMLITDMKDNLNELFKIGKEIETYSSKEELLEKINYYLTHEKERKKIAEAGQRRTLKDHTYEIRMKELTDIFNKYL